MNVTINNTVKAGYINIVLNDYFDGLNGDSEHLSPITSNEDIMKIDTVNRVTVTSFADLRTKILALL